MKNLRPLSRLLAVVLLLAVLIIPVSSLQAACGDPATGGLTGGINCAPASVSATDGVGRAVNILLYLVGVISLIVVIVGALRYVLSGGNPQATNAAKDTILYAVIGLVVALLAYAIVNFVLTRFGG